MIRASDEPRLWAEFMEHVQDCDICMDGKLCPLADHLEQAWSEADMLAQRADQLTGDGLEDCADDARPWGDDHADDPKPWQL